jgi:hypothetical protein
MTIDDAVKATRRYRCVNTSDGWYVVDRISPNETGPFSDDEAQDIRDQLNLWSVLKAIRDPSESMTSAATNDVIEEGIDGYWINRIWRAMIDALIKQIPK